MDAAMYCRSPARSRVFYGENDGAPGPEPQPQRASAILEAAGEGQSDDARCLLACGSRWRTGLDNPARRRRAARWQVSMCSRLPGFVAAGRSSPVLRIKLVGVVVAAMPFVPSQDLEIDFVEHHTEELLAHHRGFVESKL